jgi:hypothetical protein
MKASEEIKKRIMDKKWASLEKRGYSKPKDKAEEKARLKASHGF